MEILNILKDLSTTTSRNSKIAILEQHRDNELLKQFFRLSLDPLITYGIKKIPAVDTNSGIQTLGRSFELLNQLVTRELTGNAAIAHLKMILENSTEADAEVIIRCIEKDPKCGVAESSVNKVWPKLIFEFPVMKAMPYDERIIANITFPAYSQTKLDGARCALVCARGKVVALSSSGREIEVHGQFDSCGKFDGYVFDGEMLVIESTGEFMERKKGNGIVNSALAGTISREMAQRLHFVAFDLIPYDEWRGVRSATGDYRDRFTTLCSLADKFDSNMSIVETVLVDSVTKAFDHFRALLNKGEEGTILKNMQGRWEDKRSKNCIKFKNILTCDLIVSKIIEGTGKYKGKIGALLCESADGLVRVYVGSGLTDEERELTADFWCGKIIEIAYNERIISIAENSKWSLFLPRFCRIRMDKPSADTIENIP